MNPNIIKQLADAHYQLADLYTQLAADSATGPVRPASGAAVGSPAAASPSFEASPFDDEPAAGTLASHLPEYHQQTGDYGSEAVCPKHRVPYTKGSYGPYCKQRTDDPAWGKQKGDTMWCRITPKNAAEYLRIRAAA